MKSVRCEPELRTYGGDDLSFLELNKKQQSNQIDNAAHMTTRLCHARSLSNARDLHEHPQIQGLVKRLVSL